MAKGLKTHSGAKKRFTITKKKKVIVNKSCNNHLLTNKGKTNKKFKYGKAVSSCNTGRIKVLLPYN